MYNRDGIPCTRHARSCSSSQSLSISFHEKRLSAGAEISSARNGTHLFGLRARILVPSIPFQARPAVIFDFVPYTYESRGTEKSNPATRPRKFCAPHIRRHSILAVGCRCNQPPKSVAVVRALEPTGIACATSLAMATKFP